MENKTLIIYDQEGYIISQMSGHVREPIGIPYMWVEIPEGKRITGIDPETEQPIFEVLPKPEIEVLREQITMQEQAIIELSMMVGGAM